MNSRMAELDTKISDMEMRYQRLESFHGRVVVLEKNMKKVTEKFDYNVKFLHRQMDHLEVELDIDNSSISSQDTPAQASASTN